MDTQLFSPAPLRVFPGRLSVSRTIGDIEAKSPKFEGLPNIIIPTPEVSFFKISPNHDFILLGCDGIYDRLENDDINKFCWSAINDSKDPDENAACGRAVDIVIKGSICKRTLDNVTVILVAFNSLLSNQKSAYRQNQTVEAMKRNSSVDSGKKPLIQDSSSKYKQVGMTPKSVKHIMQSLSKNVFNFSNRNSITNSKNSYKPLSKPSSSSKRKN